MPIAIPQSDIINKVESLVDEIQNMYAVGHENEAKCLYKKMDKIIYEVYQITNEEIKIIEFE